MVRVLLDSNVVLFALLRPARLSIAAREALENPAHSFFISAATWYEIGWKVRLGKLALPPFRTVDDAARLLTANPVNITPAHMARAAELPPDNRDPFDRMIVAQALEEGFLLLSADAGLDLLGAPRLW